MERLSFSYPIQAPYLVYVEILVCDDVMTAPLPQRTGTSGGFTPSNLHNHRFHDINIGSSPQLTPISSKMVSLIMTLSILFLRLQIHEDP